ncbi:unnamed protein product [Rotaria sp. Silwood1]|nr:unnamed protein product [Rotaria sp. Silwood1]CAF4838372.1 unnamed protein product [Rotaria sp. Silwood1]
MSSMGDDSNRSYNNESTIASDISKTDQLSAPIQNSPTSDFVRQLNEEVLLAAENSRNSDSMLNPRNDEGSHFNYDPDTNKLVCVATDYDDIPASVIQAFALKTKILDLNGNRFRSLACVKRFPNLEELILDGNQIDDTHTRFPKLPKLHTLLLNKNSLQDICKLVEQLRHAYQMLSYLSLIGNEACPFRIFPKNQSSTENDLSSFSQDHLDEDYQRYRDLLIVRIPTLKFLDSREISANERRNAMQSWYIFNSIAETKLSYMSRATDKKESNSYNRYTPLPLVTGPTKPKILIQKRHHTYNGEESQGHRFIKDGDL